MKITSAATLGAACLIASLLSGNDASAGFLEDLLGYGSGQSYQVPSGNYGAYSSTPQGGSNGNYQYTITYHGPGGAVTYPQGQPIQPMNQVNTPPQSRPSVRYAAAPIDRGYAGSAPQPVPAQRRAQVTKKKSQKKRTVARRTAPAYPAQYPAQVQTRYPQYGGQSYGTPPSYGQAPQGAYPYGYGYGATYRQPAATSYANQYYSYGGWQSPSGQACVGST